MNLKNIDIIYFVKASDKNEELRYSLRSVEANFPHRYVWFIGGKPCGLEPDKWLYVDQNQPTKWANTSMLLRSACLNSEITDDFVLFNDDFFVLGPVKDVPYYADKDILSRVTAIRKRWGAATEYSNNLYKTYELLNQKDLPYVNYAVHYPMIINKIEMLETFQAFPTGLMWRSLYANHHKKFPVFTVDCKINSVHILPKKYATYVSTQDITFKNGDVGQYIRNMFKEPCRYEVGMNHA